MTWLVKSRWVVLEYTTELGEGDIQQIFISARKQSGIIGRITRCGGEGCPKNSLGQDLTGHLGLQCGATTLTHSTWQAIELVLRNCEPPATMLVGVVIRAWRIGCVVYLETRGFSRRGP
jgi:hypothetical protein